MFEIASERDPRGTNEQPAWGIRCVSKGEIRMEDPSDQVDRSKRLSQLPGRARVNRFIDRTTSRAMAFAVSRLFPVTSRNNSREDRLN